MPLREPPPRGTVEQHGRRPFRGAVQRLLLLFKSRRLRLAVSREAVGRSRVVQVVFMAVRSARHALFSLTTSMLSAGQTSQADNFSIATDTAGDQYCDLLATGVFAILATPPSGNKCGRSGPKDRPLGCSPADPICRLRVPNRHQVGGDWSHPGNRPASWPPIKGLPSDIDPRHSLAIPSGPTSHLWTRSTTACR